MQENFPIIFHSQSGALRLRSDIERETIWASQADIAKIFNVNPQAITKHIQHIYNDKELPLSTCSKMEQVHQEGKRKIKRRIKMYDLDMIIAVGYRINSVVGTKFRQWATKTLRDHIIKGYTINRTRIFSNYQSFIKSVEEIKKILPPVPTFGSSETIEIIKLFSQTWLSLDAYDKNKLPTKGLTKKDISLTYDQLLTTINKFKISIETSGFFAIEKEIGSINNIIGNIFQSFDGKDLYTTVEEKAAYLLYFLVKNHPFIDGNKRCGAYCFIWFLKTYSNFNLQKFTPATLTALTILVAESNPKNKDQIIHLILEILK